MPTNTFQQDGSSFRRKLSKREKKQLKKQEKLNRLKSTGAIDENDAPKVAEKLYSGDSTLLILFPENQAYVNDADPKLLCRIIITYLTFFSFR